MSEVLARALSEYPRVSQADILQLLDVCSRLTPKEHAKLFKSESKALSSQHHQARLDLERCRLERHSVIPCKTTIETIKLTNPHKSTIHWKLQRPSQVTSQFFLSCTPASGTLEKGKSVEIRVCCVLFFPQIVARFSRHHLLHPSTPHARLSPHHATHRTHS